MKISLRKIVESEKGMAAILETKLPIKIAYRLTKLSNKIRAELAVYNEQRVALVKRLGEEKGKDSWEVKPENMVEFQEEFKKLLDEVVEIDFTPLKLAELGDVVISPKDLVDWIISE